MGSNIDPESNIIKALTLLNEMTEVTGVSLFYRTKPLGNTSQPDFINGIFEIMTGLPARELKTSVLGAIETELGRVRTGDKNAPRTMDLDILLYNEKVICEGDIRIPDPQIRERAFINIPLYELAGDFVLPDSGESLKDIAEASNRDGLEELRVLSDKLKQVFRTRKS